MDLTVQTKGTLEYLTAPALTQPGLVHAFTTRFGGVSEGSLASLNLGTHRGDKAENVVKNYHILGQAVGFSPEDVVFTRQYHTDIIRRVGRANRGEGLRREQTETCDAQITNEEGVALVAFAADCTPVLLYDPVKRAIAAIHAGWRGTALAIVRKTVEALRREYGADPRDLRAAIGPCIGQCCFETDWDVPQAMLDAFGEEANGFIEQRGEKYFVDTKGLNRLWLLRAGVLPEHIDVSTDCTKCQPHRFWSHRVTGGDRGSLAGILMMTPRKEAPT